MYLSSKLKPKGLIKWSLEFVATQVLIIFPVLPGISGSNKTILIILITSKEDFSTIKKI